MRSHISRCPQFVQIQMFDSRACHWTSSHSTRLTKLT